MHNAPRRNFLISALEFFKLICGADCKSEAYFFCILFAHSCPETETELNEVKLSLCFSARVSLTRWKLLATRAEMGERIKWKERGKKMDEKLGSDKINCTWISFPPEQMENPSRLGHSIGGCRNHIFDFRLHFSVSSSIWQWKVLILFANPLGKHQG